MAGWKKITVTTKERIVGDPSEKPSITSKDYQGSVSVELNVGDPSKKPSITSKDYQGSVSVELNGFGGELRDHELFKYNTDVSNLVDVDSKELDKTLFDDFLNEDSLKITAQVPKIDLVASEDQVAVLVGAPVEDLTNNADEIAKLIATGTFANTTVTSEVIERAFQKVFLDASLAIDALAKTLQTTKDEVATASDALITQTIFNVEQSDWISASDDVLGEANTDDDQYAFVNKAVVDLLSYEEILRSDLLKVTIDTAALSEFASKLLGKTFVEALGLSELIAKSVSPSKQETASVSETRLVNLQNYLPPYYVQPGYVGTTLSI